MKLLPGFITMSVFSLNSVAQNFSAKDSLQIHSMLEDWNKAWEVKDYVLASKWYSDDASRSGRRINASKKTRPRNRGLVN